MDQRIHGFELLIDGRRVSRQVVACHYQSDPFPGGHRYELTALAEKMKALFPTVQTAYTKPGSKESMSIFWSIEALLDLSVRQQSSALSASNDVEFFLNTVDTFQLTDREVRISGVCSERIRTE